MLPIMTTANVMRVLDELRQEYADVVAQVEKLQLDLNALGDRQNRLSEAIDSLERLSEPEPKPGPEPEPDTNSTLDEVVPDGPLVPLDSPIAKYIKRGGEGRRLSSTLMVRDVVEELDRVVNREELKEAFFQRFSREEMERFWNRPDNAFGTAVNRAVKDKLIRRGNKDGFDVYGSHAVAERLRRKDQEAASPEPGAEEEE